MGAAIRYSPHSIPSRQRFLILKPAHHDLQFYQVEEIKGKAVEYRQLSRHTDFSNVKAFDWSPTEEAIVAVGLTTGEAALLRIDDNSNGVLSFNFKNPRPCNAIALGLNGYLAAGLDKVRNDSCLNIWDINQRLSTWDRRSKGWTSTRQQYEPIRRLASSETISSIKFFADNPEIVVTGVKGQFVRIYDLRDNAVNPAIQFPTRCAQYLSIDAQDENYFASASSTGEPTVCIWDRRAGPRSTAASTSPGSLAQGNALGPVLEFKNCLDSAEPSSQPSIWSVRYCKSRRGAFGVLSSQGQLKVYETAKEYAGQPTGSKVGMFDRSGEAFESQQLLYTKRYRELEQPYRDRQHNANERIESFDFMASGRRDDEYRIIACRGNGSVEAFTLRPQPPKVELSIKGDATILAPGSRYASGYGGQASFVSMTPSARKGVPTAQILKSIRSKAKQALPLEMSPETQPPVFSSRDARLRALSLNGPAGFLFDIRDVLTLGTIERRRAEEGYLFNPAINIKVLSDDPGLQDLWRWIQSAEKAAHNGGMTHDTIDLAFLGVHGVWNTDLGRSSRRRGGETNRSFVTERFVDAVQAILRNSKQQPFKSVDTAHPELRQLCLGICGWTNSPQELETELQRLIRQESRTKAAAWALFNGVPRRAIEVVLQGDDADRLVAMALATVHKAPGSRGEDDADAWLDLVGQISERARDPWSKAILAYVSTEDWRAVIDETSLPLRHRICVALKYLPDDELTRFLDDLTRDCIKAGDIEGIVLTGITEAAADLFQNYIIRHNDVQTAVLVMSHSIPLYFEDDRFQHWRAAYCDNLVRYNLHMQRCQYNQQHTKMSITRKGHVLIKPLSRQITLRCNYCEGSVASDDGLSITQASPSSTAITAPDSTSAGTQASNPLERPRSTSDVVCPRCGRHLPRCVVCMIWLGSADAGPLNRTMLTAASQDAASHFLNFCNMCHHGFHAEHARFWFARHKMCPVSECNCLCAAYEPA